MKKFYFYSLVTCLCVISSCNEEVTNDSSMRVKLEAVQSVESIAPLEFSSISDLQNTIQKLSTFSLLGDKVKAAHLRPDFISYAETVMQEDGYEDRVDAICSESFGNILNPAGEVIFDGIVLKLCPYGILYANKEQIFELRALAEHSDFLRNLTKAEDFLFSVDDSTLELLFSVNGYNKVYLLDAFGLVKNKDMELSVVPSAKAVVDGVTFVTDVVRKGTDLNGTYTIPNGGDQKNKFPSNSSVANDTKIYKENFVVYKESGVKTKTMRKKGLIWKKFDCNVTSAITDIVIRESWSNELTMPIGWVDINTTNYAGKSAVIATKVIHGVVDPTVSNTTVVNDCEAALEWGRNNGVSVSNVDGVRYIGTSDPKTAFTRIKDDIRPIYDSKCTIQFNLEPSGSFTADKSSKGTIVVYNLQYMLDRVTFYGYSEYNGDKRGSRMRYIRHLK